MEKVSTSTWVFRCDKCRWSGDVRVIEGGVCPACGVGVDIGNIVGVSSATPAGTIHERAVAELESRTDAYPSTIRTWAEQRDTYILRVLRAVPEMRRLLAESVSEFDRQVVRREECTCGECSGWRAARAALALLPAESEDSDGE